MDRYALTFAQLKQHRRFGFCPFAVLGDPTEAKTLERVKKYIEAGADFLELGIPFSDPTADGPVIQAASERALKNSMTPRKAIRLVQKIRALTAHYKLIPIGILTYSNIVLRYGKVAPFGRINDELCSSSLRLDLIAKFYSDLKRAGADSILIADVPLEEIAPFARAAKKYKLHQIFLVSEYTDARRLKKIEKIASGFLYVVSALGVTGARERLPQSLKKLIRFLKQKTNLPLMVGFGISKPAHTKQLSRMGADGFIVGSALVKTPLKQLKTKLRTFVPRGKILSDGHRG